jgi:glyoxylase-like metal-dependent hydrolase (beta-lactamase superfamily II)
MSAPTLLGVEMPDVAIWSDRVVVALGQNPSMFTGPGTNTYLLGTGSRRILLDPGEGQQHYLPVLERALEEAGCEGIERIVLTHGHPDHIGGVRSVLERFGPMPVSKKPWHDVDTRYDLELEPLDDGSVVEAEGVTLRALHTPGHAPDHLCFVLEEEDALISGDNVLGVGTTVIPMGTGSLADYLASLERMLEAASGRIYPAHGPVIEDGPGKIREYLSHRADREREIAAQLGATPQRVLEIVASVYSAYPKRLHAAAAQSVTHHLLKLEADGRARRDGGKDPLAALWRSA